MPLDGTAPTPITADATSSIGKLFAVASDAACGDQQRDMAVYGADWGHHKAPSLAAGRRLSPAAPGEQADLK
jgi:hypothetical protein